MKRIKLIGMRLLSIPYGIGALLATTAWWTILLVLLCTIGLPCWIITGRVLPFEPNLFWFMYKHEQYTNKL